MTTLNIGIIGCGAATKRYYVSALKKHLPSIDKLFIVDLDASRADEIAQEIGKGEVVSDYHDIINQVNGAVIVLPNSLHYPVAMDLLKSGVHILCEKPLAESVKEVKEMIETAEKIRVSISVNNTRRMFPSFRKVKEIIDGGKIGAIQSIKYMEGNTFAWPSASSFYVDPSVTNKGLLIDLGPHVLDLICWWLNTRPDIDQYLDDSFGGPESVADIKASLNECDIEVFLNRLNDLDNSFHIKGEKGEIIGQIFDWNKLTVKWDTGETENIKLKNTANSYPDFVIPIVDNFMETIKGKVKPLISGIDVLHSIEMIENCYQNRKRFDLLWYQNLEEIIESR